MGKIAKTGSLILTVLALAITPIFIFSGTMAVLFGLISGLFFFYYLSLYLVLKNIDFKKNHWPILHKILLILFCIPIIWLLVFVVALIYGQ